MRAWKMHGVIGTWHAAGGETQKNYGRHHYFGPLVTFLTASWPEYGTHGARLEIEIVFSGKFFFWLYCMHAHGLLHV
jgi:hypothetical protein